MQCNKCNAFIPEGYMYCPVCGEEIIIVSDFEIKLEDNIDTAAIASTVEIPDINQEINKKILISRTQEIITDIDKNNNSYNKLDLDKQSKVKPYVWIISVLLSLIIISGIVIGAISIYRYTSYDYQLKKASIEAENGELEKAVKTLKHAIELNSENDDIDAQKLLADCYMGQSNYDAAIAVLIKCLDYHGEDNTLYDTIVDCYKKQGDSRGINELIKNSSDPNLALRYSDYVSILPVFSLEEGTYIEPDPIKITIPDGGKVYYTTDGSIPSEKSLEYMGPIPLDTGETTISAIHINENGIVSEVVKKTYVVELNIPDDPELMVPSGTYNKPELIGVNIAEEFDVYYSTDGSVPDTDSTKYNKPFLMPLGKSNYTFIAYNSEGNSSKKVIAVYDLEINDNIDTSTAEYAISYQLTSMGEFVIGNTYTCKYGYNDGSRTYYIIEEYVGGQKSNRMFAVDVSSGGLYTFNKNSFSINPL